MVQFNFSERTIKAKVVYYGPAQSGKTTNLEQIHRLTDPEGTNRLISLNTAQDRTLFFDLLPFSLGAVSGYDFKVQIYTIPGQVQYNATRRVVLAGADAVVFVADSRRAAFKENTQAFENMKVNLLANRLVPEKVPLVLQWNKQDLDDLTPEPDLEKGLNFWGRKSVRAVASRGQGVMETFVAVVQDMLAAIAVKYNLKEKGLDPGSVPLVVEQAFTALSRKAAAAAAPTMPGAPASAPAPPPPRVVLSQATDPERAMPLPSSGGEAGLVSEELLHRAIRSNVELAETLGNLVREMNLGLSSIASHAEVASGSRDEARRASALGSVAAGVGAPAPGPGRGGPAGLVAAGRGRSPASPAAGSHGSAGPAAWPRPRPWGRSRPVPARRPVAAPASPPVSAAAASLDVLVEEAVEASRAELQVNAVSVAAKVAPGTGAARVVPPSRSSARSWRSSPGLAASSTSAPPSRYAASASPCSCAPRRAR